ncbi:alpha/beta-hydrolase [Astrocystis sublimbata]|nr:alpha/beta-hydrolase [Astrocystis sublimbata]
MIWLQWLMLPLFISSVAEAANPRVDLGYVQYEGLSDTTLNITTFFGIRYAAPPTGLSRWRAPVPIELDNDYTDAQIINATRPGPQCNQRLKSEDCLLLDVIAPLTPSLSSLLPVVVDIHGGGFVSGNTQTADASHFVSYARGSVIWVSIQYRLGAYGFLGAREVLADGDPNIGLLDQRSALQWVQKHISMFGGDPEKVTLWGVSAGGGSVVDQMIMDRDAVAVPYRAAVAESPWFQPYHDSDILEAQYRDLLSSSRCPDLACLRGLSEEALWMAANETIELGIARGLKASGDFYWGPYVDGTLIPDLPSIMLASGNYHSVPLLVDHSAQEGKRF